MPDDQRQASRYETAIASLVGLLAIGVSAYTAYVQRQQVRAQVWPIVEYSSSNAPSLRLSIANKGPGPALVKHVIINVDGKPMKLWRDVMTAIMGPGQRNFMESTMRDKVLSAGESIDIFEPREGDGPMPFAKEGSPGDKFNKGRGRISVEICYCSTLGDCWTLRAGGDEGASTTEAGRCPARSDVTFLQ